MGRMQDEGQMVRRNLASSLIEAMDVAARQEAVIAKSWRLFQEVGRARLRSLPGAEAYSATAIAGGGEVDFRRE